MKPGQSEIKVAESRLEQAVKALEKTVKEANLLLQNAIGCAVNHHSGDFEEQGLPGWLRDAELTINDAAVVLSTLSSLRESGA